MENQFRKNVKEELDYRREVMGLLTLPPERRETEVQKLLDLLKCKHESDGMVYTSNPPKWKCKKCGEYYQ